jgi:hypothetical protein
MAKWDEPPRTNPAEVENLIEQILGTNLEPGAEEKIERLLSSITTYGRISAILNLSAIETASLPGCCDRS